MDNLIDRRGYAIRTSTILAYNFKDKVKSQNIKAKHCRIENFFSHSSCLLGVESRDFSQSVPCS